MDRRTLGPTGSPVSVIGLGCNSFGMLQVRGVVGPSLESPKVDRDASATIVTAALDAGVTLFDTAELYGEGRSEEYLGAALRSRRDEAVIATKFQPRPHDEPYAPGDLARRIREGCEASLRRLGTDRIDLYYQHMPDPDAPLEEAFEALDQLVAAGKVLQLGSARVNAEQIRAAGPRVAVTQIEWNLLARGVEAEDVPAAREAGIGVVPYYPLASGLLTGKYRKNERFPEGSRFDSLPYFASVATEENFDRVERLRAFAEQRELTLPQVAVGWLLAQDPVASVICGATTPGQVRDNVRGAECHFDAGDLAEIERCVAAQA